MAKRALPVFKETPLDAERLFTELFLPLYPPDVELERLRRTDANPARNPNVLAALHETARVFARLAPEALGAPGLELDGTDASVHRLSAALTREARDRLLVAKSPGEPPLLVHVVLHGTAYLAACIVDHHGGEWMVRNPLWETRVRLASRAGEAELAPFSWWLRALSDDGVGRHVLADRYRSYVEVPTEDTESWPVLAPPERRLPRLGRVRYDMLYKWLKAHLPELRDLGADFPSAERFEELGFEWLEGRLVGGGRALLLHGPTKKGGLHLFWVTAQGFSKAMFLEADGVPEHRVEESGEKLVVTASVGGRMVSQELLWWGP